LIGKEKRVKLFCDKPLCQERLMPINQMYRTWIRRICELRPDQRITQVRNFVWLVVGIFHSRSVQLSQVAGKVLGQAKNLSTVRRLSRFLDNPAIQVRDWYEPIAHQWLEAQLTWVGEIRLIVDGTRVGFGHQLLMVSLAYRHRAIPIAWTWVKQVRGHSSGRQQLALLEYVKGLLPKKPVVFLVGDSEFGSILVLRQLAQWRWFYVLRQKARTCVWNSELVDWRKLGSFVQKAGQHVWIQTTYLTKKEMYRVSILIDWADGEKEPWCLATNLPDRTLTLRYYKRRMWIEEMFGDLKGHGFDLESTMLRHFSRLSRLTLAVAFLYVWLLSNGGKFIRIGLRHLVDRTDRRDLSLFQIGLRLIERRLLNLLPVSDSLCAYL
jgi:DDE family transposase